MMRAAATPRTLVRTLALTMFLSVLAPIAVQVGGAPDDLHVTPGGRRPFTDRGHRGSEK